VTHGADPAARADSDAGGACLLIAVADLGRIALTSAGTADEVIEAALDSLCDTLHVDAAVIAEVDLERQVLVHRAARGLQPSDVPDETPLNRSFGARALIADDSFATSNLADVLEPDAPYRRFGAVAAVSSIVRGHDAPFGVLNVLSRTPRVFTQEEIVFVRSTANVIAAGVERDRLGETLRRQNRLLENVIEHAPDIVIRFDRDLRHLLLSAAVEEATGMPASAFLGKTNRELGMDEELCLLWERELLPAFETAQPRAFEFSFPAVDGERLFESRVVPELGEDGTVETLLVISRDMTTADHARRALEASELRYRELFEHADDMIMLFDLDRRFVNVNPAVVKSLGYEASELIGSDIGLILDTAELGAIEGRFEARRAGASESTRYETVLRTKVGRTVPVEANTRGVVRDGETVGVLGVCRDLTDRKRYVGELAANEELFRTAFEDAPIGIALVGTDLRYTRVNRALADMLGYSDEELCRLTVHDVAHPDEVEQSLKYLRMMLDGEIESFSREKRLLHRDGSTVWAQISGAPVRGPGGEVRFFVSQTQNITAAKAVAQELRESQALHRLVVENARDLIAVIGLDGCIRLVSASVEPSLGWMRDELIGRPFAEFLHPDEIPAVQESIVATLERNESNPMRVRVLHRDGSWRILEAAGAAAYEAGRPDFLVVTAKDVTEREELEAQLRQSQKLEAIGKLAGGVAHDFNNLLTAINGYSDVALAALEDTDSRARHAVEEIRRAGERAAELTQQLLAFGRRQTLRPKVVSVNEIVEDCAGLLHRVLGEDVALRTKLDSTVANVLADPGQLGQVLMNLAVNARDAMPGGGELRIETANDGPFVRVDVVDDGEGMDAETRAKAFDPFFTTKELGSGTGLGLATVLGIVQQSGGRVDVVSEPGEGTTFSVFLPATEEQVTEPAPLSADEPAALTGRILVVEDDHAVRALVVETLEDAGFEVIEAPLPSAALELVDGEDLDLLLTDIVMPEMNGRELARRILELRPGLRVLYTSGYAADVVSERRALDEGDAFIQKPYPTAALIEAVRELLAGQPRPKSELSSAKNSASPA